ncbi:MAG: NAD-binding protein [Deltaproteobacteria bacterium]|nr:NAD-binding protein [Deltaproteobacteria bacterium]
MNCVFRNHIVICGWNRRGKAVVENLQALSKRPILILHDDLKCVLKEVGSRPNVFLMQGDSSKASVLERADVARAYSVLVLALEKLGASADARSVQIALAVERIRTAVYTIVELKDIQNKQHFSWTKVDDLITDQEIAVRVLSQAVRHLMQDNADAPALQSERNLLKLYRQLIDPQQNSSQIYRIDLEWEAHKHLTFSEILVAGLRQRTLPLAVVGFKHHRQPEVTSSSGVWLSWKSDVIANPPPHTVLRDIWKVWPSDESPLGILVLAKSRAAALELCSSLINRQAA